ncbi:histidinol-phosphate transaminase [Selenihalanaerobacter shriftii]|uniref:Histidinol-phosphate aminotransferase n=1 Tax=Selenihalanaerobacter shriftii TaxID=142842 RepID=A0A1T4LIW1_9FIRM|nr:histidinol-phosphate transaminase [Selenihalanaerobacter shriftii]SJZ54689.1 histidinol phosphate aminotransferase apoenzyme [Selenihalanaerobacter shriftii]
MIREAILDIKPYVPGKPIEEVKRELGLDDVIKLASNENPIGPSDKAIEVMQETAKSVHIYPDGNCHSLRKALSEKLAVKEDQLIFGNGSDGLLSLIAEAFVNPEDEVLMAEPSFSQYEFVTNVMGGELISVPLDNYTYDLPALLDAINENTKMIFVCNPNNPTGTVVPEKEVKEFLAKVPEDIIVIMDEAYNEYVTVDEYPETINYLNDYDNLIILRTFSKAYGLAGLRIGYGIANKELIGYMDRVRHPFNVNLIAQRAAVAALEDETHLNKSREVNAKGKEYLYQEFERLNLDYVTTETNFILVDVKEDAGEISDKILQRGVIIRNAQAFGYETMIRVTIGTEEQNQQFINNLEKVLT